MYEVKRDLKRETIGCCGIVRAVALFQVVGQCAVSQIEKIVISIKVGLSITHKTVSVSKFQGQRLEVLQILNCAPIGRGVVRVES